MISIFFLLQSFRFEHQFCPNQYDPVYQTNSNLQTSTSIVINRRPNDSTVPYVNLRVFNCMGSKCTIYAPSTLTFADVKRKVVAEFHARRQLFLTPCVTQLDCMPGSSRDRIEEHKLSCDNLDLIQLSRHYKLTRISKLHEDIDEQSSLSTANVQNNEEMLLILCTSNAAAHLNAQAPTNDKHTSTTLQTNASIQSTTGDGTAAPKLHSNNDSDSDSDDNDATNNALPTQHVIDLATEFLVMKNAYEPNMINIDELVLQSDVQYDIRKILISLANACAYVIGSGPYASRIITMLKHRLIQRKQHEQDTQQCLIEMGFSRPKVQHALNINK